MTGQELIFIVQPDMLTLLQFPSSLHDLVICAPSLKFGWIFEQLRNLFPPRFTASHKTPLAKSESQAVSMIYQSQ